MSLVVCNLAVVKVASFLGSILLSTGSQTLVKKRQLRHSRDLSEQPLAEEEMGALVQRRPSEPPLDKQSKPSWWWVELWSDKRRLIREAAAHSFLFAGLFVSLEGAHRLLKWSTLPAEGLFVLNKIHFYMYAIIPVIFAVSLIIKVLNSELLGQRDETPSNGDISLVKAFLRIYRGWGSQVFVYFITLVFATTAALVLDLRLHWSPGSVLLYVLPLAALLLIVVPTRFVVLSDMVRDGKVHDLKPRERVMLLGMEQKEDRNARLIAAGVLISLSALFYVAIPVKRPFASSLSQSDLIITDVKFAPLEYQLAYLDSGQLPRGTDLAAARIRFLLKSLAEKTGDSDLHIADKTSAATETLKRDYGREVTRQKFLEEANNYSKDRPQISYDSLSALLIVEMGK